MSQSDKTGATRRVPPSQENFFSSNDAAWLTDVVARELKEKIAATTPAPAPKVRKPDPTPPPRRAATRPAAGTPPRADRAEEEASSAAPKRRRLANPFRRKANAPAAQLARPAARSKPKQDRSDFIVGALGITLGLTCALFPWYIFFNQEKFGVREFVFSGEGGRGAATHIAYQPTRIGQPFAQGDVPRMDLDFFPTATLPAEGASRTAAGVAAQPFPPDLVSYQLVHVANGRAMIMDDAGLWVVQPGSQLPDASRVASIEKRGNRWVIVTTLDRVIELAP